MSREGYYAHRGLDCSTSSAFGEVLRKNEPLFSKISEGAVSFDIIQTCQAGSAERLSRPETRIFAAIPKVAQRKTYDGLSSCQEDPYHPESKAFEVGS